MKVSHVLRGLAKSVSGRGVLRTALGSVGGAILAGIGFKIGSDLYDGIKKRRRPKEEAEEQREEY